MVANAASAQPVKRHPQVVSCSNEIARDRTQYDASIKAHVADGKIDATEKAALDKTHSELLALEKKAMEDGKMSPEECKVIHAKIIAENKQLAAAIGVRQKGHHTARVARHPKVLSCAAEIAKERTHYDASIKAHVADGKIDATEKAALDKTHGELLAMEKKAAEDGKMTPEECAAIHTKIVAEHKQLVAALAVKKVAPPKK